MIYKQSGRIEIIVRKDDTSSMVGANEQDTNQSPNANKTESISKSKKFLGMNGKQAKLLTAHTLTTAQHYFYTFTSMHNTNQGRIYGDQALQAITERNMEIMKDVVNPALSIIGSGAGAALATGGNPVAVAISMGFAAVNTGLTLYRKYEERAREYNYKVAKENNAIEYKRARANVNWVNGRMR